MSYIQEVSKVPEVSLGLLRENDTVGILCRSCDRTLHFYIGSTHLEVKLPDGDMRLPTSRYAVVDMYGQCSAVEFRGLENVCRDQNYSDNVIRVQIDKEQLTHVKRHLKNSKKSATKHQQEQHAVREVTRVNEQDSLRLVAEGDTQQQVERGTGLESLETGVRSAHNPTRLSCAIPTARGQCDVAAYSCVDCAYYKLCRGFLDRLLVPGIYMWVAARSMFAPHGFVLRSVMLPGQFCGEGRGSPSFTGHLPSVSTGNLNIIVKLQCGYWFENPLFPVVVRVHP